MAVSRETGRYNKSFRREEVLAICDLSYTPIIPAAPPPLLPPFLKSYAFLDYAIVAHPSFPHSEKELQPLESVARLVFVFSACVNIVNSRPMPGRGEEE